MDIIDKKQLAEKLGVHGHTVARWSANGALPPPIRLGKRMYWTLTALEAFLRKLEKANASK